MSFDDFQDYDDNDDYFYYHEHPEEDIVGLYENESTGGVFSGRRTYTKPKEDAKIQDDTSDKGGGLWLLFLLFAYIGYTIVFMLHTDDCGIGSGIGLFICTGIMIVVTVFSSRHNPVLTVLPRGKWGNGIYIAKIILYIIYGLVAVAGLLTLAGL